MANVKITELSAIANPASTDVLAIVDVTADITKKVTIADLLENAGDGTAAAPAFSFNSDTNTGVFLEAADKLGFSTNGTGRIYIDASGNVGIAKSNPTQTLDVNGTAAVSGALTQGGNNVVTVGDTGTVTSTMIANGTIVDADVSATAEIAVSKLANGTARQLLQTDAAGTGVEFTSNVDVPGTLDVTGVATFDSNVTVGGNLTVNGTTTTIDSTTLVVEDKNIEMGAVTTPSDTTADGGGITLKGATDKTLTWVNSTDCWTFNQALNLTAGTQSAPALVFDADVNSGIFHPTADTLAASTSGSERVRITQNGYILVGTNSEPSGGDAHSRNARLLIHGRIGNTADSGRLNLQRGSAASNGSSIGSITFTDNGNNAYARIETLADAATGTNDYPGAIAFSTTPDGAASPTERLRISSSGDIGIATSSPTARLSVNNNTATGNVNLADFHAPAANANGLVRVITRNAANTGTTSVDFYKVYQSGFEIKNNDTASSNFTSFSVGASERMRINSSGNVGIGTTTPSQTLEVNGLVSLNRSPNNDGAIYFGSGTDNYLYGSSDLDLVAFGVNGSERLRIASNGNVGIGTSSPATPLHVDGTTATPVIFESSNSQSLINFRNSSTSLFFMGASSNNWNVQTNGVERLSVTTIGNVGIGTTSPGHTLEVNGDVQIGPHSDLGDVGLYVTGRVSSNDRAINILSVDGNGGGIIGTTGDSGANNGLALQAYRGGGIITFATGGANERMRIASNGNVGIGTTSPSDKLSIASTTGSAGTSITAAGNAYLELDSSVGGTAGNQLSYIDFKLNGAVKGNISINEGVSGQPLEINSATNNNIVMVTGGGKVGIGTSAPIAKLTSLGINSEGEGGTMCIQNTGAGVNTNVALYLTPNNGGGNDLARTAAIKSRQDVSGNYANLEFYTSQSATPERRMTIASDGKFFINTLDDSLYNNNASNQQGLSYVGSEFGLARWSDNVAYFNRMGTDGAIVRFMGQGNLEGSITVDGTTVTLNGGHLSRWSQLAGNAERIEILRGSVLSNLDEMCEWGDEDNEQLNRMQVSDVEGDRNVAGVFQSWDDDDDIYTNDFYCAMTGDFVIRIAQGTTVARGDLLMSAGDGTAKPQDDDLVRSKTIAKVTSTTVSVTYADGSYCVPCVLMAC